MIIIDVICSTDIYTRWHLADFLKRRRCSSRSVAFRSGPKYLIIKCGFQSRVHLYILYSQRQPLSGCLCLLSVAVHTVHTRSHEAGSDVFYVDELEDHTKSGKVVGNKCRETGHVTDYVFLLM